MRETLHQPGRLRRRRRGVLARLWAEWCFARVVMRHFRTRFLLMALILLCGAALFLVFEPEKDHSYAEALYFSWSLVFGEPPEQFPRSGVLQVAFFLLPILGLVVIIEAIVDFGFVLRDRRRSERGWCKMMADSFSEHIVLVGLGKLGFRTYSLLRELGEKLVVIERSAENQFLDTVRRDGTPLFIGDARRHALLVDANVARAKSVVVATDDDLANLETALDARRIAPGIRVVLRMFDQNMADKIRDGFSIHLAMSQSAISAPAFATAAIDASIVNSYMVGDRLVVAQRWLVQPGGQLDGETVGSILARYHFGVVDHQPNQGPRRLFPPPEVRLAAGDRLIVQGPFEAIVALRKKARGLAEPG
jgi:voltage-gated potassium channel